MGKAKRKAEKAAKAVLGVGAAKELKAKKKNAGTPIVATDVKKSIPESVPRTEPPWKNKEKPLILCARGITYRYRHLMTDIMQLIPHHKTDSKLDTKHDWNVINEVAELKVLCFSHCVPPRAKSMHSADGAGDERIIFATLESLNDDTFSTKISEAPSAFDLLHWQI